MIDFLHAAVVTVECNAQRMIAAGASGVRRRGWAPQQRFDLGRPWLLGDALASQATKVRPNVSTAVAANLADEQTFDIRKPQVVWPAID
jgi:hypothetical protein